MTIALVYNTPWEVYDVDGISVNVKREDLACPAPGPSFSKVRGVRNHILNALDNDNDLIIGVLDTMHSMAGWGVAYICKELEVPCINYFPIYKSELKANGNYRLRYNQRMAHGLGAELFPLLAGRSAILYHQAKKELFIKYGCKGYMMPNALKLQESVSATCVELLYTPRKLLKGTWVVSISSGTLAAGIVMGLDGLGFNERGGNLVLHMGYSRSQDATKKYIHEKAGAWIPNTKIVDEGYEYKDKVDNSNIPFPCNEYYDAKAWKWLENSIHYLVEPIVFWNIGA